jgi:hypothetical protein
MIRIARSRQCIVRMGRAERVKRIAEQLRLLSVGCELQLFFISLPLHRFEVWDAAQPTEPM